MVNVDGRVSPFWPVRGFVLNVNDAPEGKPVALRFALHDPEFPLKVTFTMYVAGLPATTAFGLCVPTATLATLLSVNVI
jgi:hypothetical protein